MSNTKDTKETGLDEAAIDASISVLGEDAGEPKVARIDDEAKIEAQAGVEETGGEDAAGGVESADTAGRRNERHEDAGSGERPTADPDLN